MAPACPIAFRQIDGTITRINSLSISMMLMAYLFSSEIIFIYILGIDLIIRLFINKKLSPINLISNLIKALIRAQTHNTDAGAKRLAAYFALGFSWTVIALHALGLFNIANVVAVIFVSCSVTELLFNYCIGCKIYFIYKKITA
jgi:hydrogenase/urease accessory protein HupE